MTNACIRWMKRPYPNIHPPLTNCGHVFLILSCFSLFGLIFGLIFTCSGCNPETQSTCLNYNPIRATVYDYSVSNHSCTVCNNYYRESCISESIGTCYNSYVEFSYSLDGADKQCYDHIMTDVLSAEYALKIAENKYSLGHTYYMLTTKHDTSQCFIKAEEVGNWIAGTVLLCLVGSVSGTWFCFYFCAKDFLIPPPEVTIHPEAITNVDNTGGITNADIDHDSVLFANDIESADDAVKTTDDSNDVVTAHIVNQTNYEDGGTNHHVARKIVAKAVKVSSSATTTRSNRYAVAECDAREGGDVIELV